MNKLCVTALFLLFVSIILTPAHPTWQHNVRKTQATIGAEDNADVLSDADETLDLYIDENVGLGNSGSYEKEVEDSGSNTIFQTILSNVRKGQVTNASLSRWMSQIKNAMSRGTLSSQAVSRFMDSLKEKLSRTPFGERCCPLG